MHPKKQSTQFKKKNSSNKNTSHSRVEKSSKNQNFDSRKMSDKKNQHSQKNEKMVLKPNKNQVLFIKSGFLPQDYPVHKYKEIAFVGRSNAGKSSLINALSGRDVAHVSQTPGKTRLLNFFNYRDSYVLVDMPGYGFAARSGSEIKEWQKVIETYLSNRECLAGLVLVMDVRRDWEENERMIYAFAHKVDLPILVALTKIDRLNQKELRDRLASLNEQSPTSLLFPVSSTVKKGFKEMEEYIYREWIKEPQK